jgi:hypothetical protein
MGCTMKQHIQHIISTLGTLVEVISSNERKNKKVEVELEPGQYQWAWGYNPSGGDIDSHGYK